MDVLYEPVSLMWLGQPYVLFKPIKSLPYPARFTADDVLEARDVVFKVAALLSDGASFAVANALVGAYERNLGGMLSEDDLVVLFRRYGLDLTTGALHGMHRSVIPAPPYVYKAYKHLRFFA